MKKRYQNKTKLIPALSWKTLISEVKSMPKGSAISYGCTHILKRDSKIAVLPIGYFDGIFRMSSSKGWAVVNGVKVPQIGRVTMNIIVFDVTDVKNVKEGDVVTIIGNDGKQTITADEWASWAQTSNYEIVTRINSGMKRVVK
jgi:alanine racemase